MDQEKPTTDIPTTTQINQSNNGLDPKVTALLSYLLWLVGGIVFYAISKDKYVKFHAAQSILFNLVVAIFYVFMMIFGFLFWYLFGVVSIIIWAVIFATWLLLMIKAYQGVKFKLPIIGNLAEKFAK